MTDREGIAITMAMGNAPQAVAMELQKGYAERYDWIVKEFTYLAFTFVTSFLYYTDYDNYRMGFPLSTCHGADVPFLHAHG